MLINLPAYYLLTYFELALIDNPDKAFLLSVSSLNILNYFGLSLVFNLDYPPP